MTLTVQNTLLADFILNATARGALTVEVATMDEAIVLYHKSGGGMEGIVNTVHEIGEVNVSSHQNTITSYQVWIKGSLAEAGGEIWVGHYESLRPVLPLNCEHLVVVLDAADNVAAFSRGPQSGKGLYLFENLVAESTYPSPEVVIYIINKEFKKMTTAGDCGRDCRC